MKDSGCCGADEFLKLWAFTLTEYHRVVHLDMDSVVFQNMDELYDIDKEMLYTGDYGMKGDSPVPPAQGGFLVVRPSLTTFSKFQEIIRKGDHSSSSGWGNTHIGNSSVYPLEIVIIIPMSDIDQINKEAVNTTERSDSKRKIFSVELNNINVNSSSPNKPSIDTSVAMNQFVFIEPDVGTPAAAALAANAAIKVSKVSKGLKKLKGKLRGGPKMKNLNIVRKIKKTTKRNRVDHFSRNFKGKVIDGLHELYTLTAGMMLGIRCLLSRKDLLSNEDLTIDDFNYVQKQSFPAKGSNTPPNISPPHSLVHTFKFKSYAPKVFNRIRDFFGIDVAGFMVSVCGNYNYLEFIANSKSRQFFFYSHDVRILGMYRLKMYHLKRKVHFVIMSSVFDTSEKIHTIYDLKGSLVGRKVTPEERSNGGVLKDVDLIEDKVKFNLGSKKAAFMEQLQKDASFLASLNIMDYSLLIGIHDRNKRSISKLNASSQLINSDISPNSLTVSVSDNQDYKLVKASNDDLIGPTNVHSNTPFRKNIYQNSFRLDVKRPDTFAHQTSVNTVALSDDSTTNNNIQVNTTVLASESLDEPVSPKSPSGRQRISRRKSRRDSFSDLSKESKSINGVNKQQSLRSTDDNSNSPHREITPPKVTKEDSGKNVKFNFSEVYEVNDEVPLEEDEYEYDDENEEDSEIDIEDEEEEHFDDGDSDFDSLTSTPIPDSDRPNSCETVEVDGSGSGGFEGAKLSTIFRSSDVLVELAKQNSIKSSKPELVFGPSETKRHPWTSRFDCGINSRLATNERGNEIYYVGIIDILQQYNGVKKIENLIKGFQYDRKQISAVDSEFYAKRFVKFIDENTE
eukprot:gene18924-24731_t